jgi:hypothetical protein
MRLLHGSNVEIVTPNLKKCQSKNDLFLYEGSIESTNQRIRNMEERYFKFEDLMADLAAYLVSEYDIEPRDAAGLVMNSPQTQTLYSSEEPITDQRVKALAEELLKERIV